jgi:putative redox protein
MPKHVVAVAFVANDEKPYGVCIEAGGHDLRADEPAQHGDGDSRPSELGACTAMTLRMYAERKRWPLDGVEVQLSYVVPDRAQRWIDRAIILHGPLDEAQRATLTEVAEVAPVTRAVRSGSEIHTTVGMPAVEG